AEDVLALRRSGNDLLHVHRVRRREDDGIDVGRVEHFLEARVELQLVLLAEGLHVVVDRAGGARDEAHPLALPRYGLDERAPPPAESYDCRIDHPIASSLRIRGRSPYRLVIQMPSWRVTKLSGPADRREAGQLF